MEERNFKSIPRAGPSYAGESRLSASAESCRLYTGPTKIALCEEGAETARRKEGEEEREKEVATTTTGNRTDYNDDQRQATRTPIVVMERGRSTRRKTPGRTTRRSIILGSEPDTADETPVDIVCSAGTSREVSLDRDCSAGVTYAELMGRDWSLNSESEPTAVKRRLRDFGAAADKLAKAKRGRTRTCAGRSSARPGQAGRDTSEEAREGEFEVSLESRAFRKPRETAVDIGPILPGPLDLDLDQMGTDDLKAAAEGNLKEILDLTGRSTNLKGGYSNKIRRSAGVLKVVLDTLATRTEAEEVRRLKADNGRLSREVANLKEEVRAYKRDFEEARKEVAEGRKTASPMSNEQLGILESNIARLVGNLVDGRLAALEDRLPHPPPVIRPPLRADSSRIAKAARAAVAASRTSSKRVSTEGVRSSTPPPHKDAPTVKATQKPLAVEEFPPLPVRPAVRLG